MAVIELIPNEKYKIDCWPDGRNGKRYRAIFYGTQAEAETEHRRIMRQHVSTRSCATNPRLVDVQPEFETWLKGNVSEGYQKTWKWALKRFMPHFGIYPVSRITKQIVNDYKVKKKDTPVALQQDLDYLRIYINWMVREGYAAAPLPFQIEKVKYQKPLPRPASVNEFDEFIAYIERSAKQARLSKKELAMKKALFLLIYESTGMRGREARHLLWEDVNLAEKWCYLRETKTKVPRLAVLPDSVIELLEPYKKKSGYVFVNPRTEKDGQEGKPYGSFKTLFKNFREDTGIRIKGPHSFRHSMGTDIINATGDVRSAQKILGHTDLKSTQIYTTVALEKQREVIQKVAEYRKKKKQVSTVGTSENDKNSHLRIVK